MEKRPCACEPGYKDLEMGCLVATHHWDMEKGVVGDHAAVQDRSNTGMR